MHLGQGKGSGSSSHRRLEKLHVIYWRVKTINRSPNSAKENNHNVLCRGCFKSRRTCSSQMHGQAAVARLHVPKSHCEQKEVSALARAERAEQPSSQLPACSGMGGRPS